MQISARSLFEQTPLLLDVRNQEEVSRWPVEGPRKFDSINIPYFEFIEDESKAVERVKTWLAGRTEPLAVICAKGGSSEFVADLLRGRGITAHNVEGGMLSWGSQTLARSVPTRSPLRVWQVHRFGKGCLSHIVAAGEDAVVVDPHRRHEEYLSFLQDQKLKLRGVIDTHLHADHISGGPALARQGGVPYDGHSADFSDTTYAYEPVEKQRRISLGRVDIVPLDVIPTPGHTPGSTCFLANGQVLLTGDTMFVGSIGRPDLGGKTVEWARDLHRSLTVTLASVSGGALVLPAHTSGPAEMKSNGVIGETLDVLRKNNAALALDESAFVRQIQEQVVAAPPQYSKIRQVNLGRTAATEEELEEMELGKNECALKRR